MNSKLDGTGRTGIEPATCGFGVRLVSSTTVCCVSTDAKFKGLLPAGLEFLRADGRSRQIFFVVPSGVTWALPIYEIALMTDGARST